MSLPVIGDPFTGLLSVLEMAGTHQGAVFTELFPIAVERAVCSDGSSCPDSAVLEMVDALFKWLIHDWTSITLETPVLYAFD
jgi:hypothetical protein